MGTLAPVARICGREAEIQALGEALARTAVLGLRAYAVAPSHFLARTAMIDAGDRVH